MVAIRLALLNVMLAVAVIGCTNGDADEPYLEFAGGGFIFNYRLATADYGFVIRMLRKVPAGTIIEAQFENPSGGPPIVIRQVARSRRLTYKFETPPVSGIKANADYRVEVRLVDPGDNRVFARYSRSFHADVGQDILPEKPPVIGPGYQPNPKAKSLQDVRYCFSANRSVARTSASRMPGSLEAWPASGTRLNSASGQAWWSSQADCTGVQMS
jgi:hypothetical protein